MLRVQLCRNIKVCRTISKLAHVDSVSLRSALPRRINMGMACRHLSQSSGPNSFFGEPEYASIEVGYNAHYPSIYNAGHPSDEKSPVRARLAVYRDRWGTD